MVLFLNLPEKLSLRLYQIAFWGITLSFLIYFLSQLSLFNRSTFCPEIKEVYVRKDVNLNKEEEYCSLLSSAIQKNESSIVQLIKLPVKIEDYWIHGEVIIQLIDVVGEKTFIHSILKLSILNKARLLDYISRGFLQTNLSLYKGKRFEELFPRLYIYLVDSQKNSNN